MKTGNIAHKVLVQSGGTNLRFTQIGVPAQDYASKNKGWRTHYWQPLKFFLKA